MYSRAVWQEGSKEVEGVVPSKWIASSSSVVFYPPKNAKSAAETALSPAVGWKEFRLIKTKFSSGKLL